MMPRVRDFATHAGLAAASLLVGLLFCEFILFRFVALPSDVPTNAFANGLVRYAPKQSGVWRVRNEIAAAFAVNAQGWNSGVGDYDLARKPGIGRVAVGGDSMVEALQVAHDKSVAECLAAELSRDGNQVEVYRFAVSGAPLSQYLNMVEREVLHYSPDWIAVVLHRPEERAKGLNHPGSPHRYRVDYELLIDEPFGIEQRVHKVLSTKREGKEWFRCTAEEAIAAIKQVAGSGFIRETYKAAERAKAEALHTREIAEREAEQQLSKEESEIRQRFQRQIEASLPPRPFLNYWSGGAVLCFITLAIFGISDAGASWLSVIGGAIGACSYRTISKRRERGPVLIPPSKMNETRN